MFFMTKDLCTVMQVCRLQSLACCSSTGKPYAQDLTPKHENLKSYKIARSQLETPTEQKDGDKGGRAGQVGRRVEWRKHAFCFRAVFAGFGRPV